MEGCNRVQLIVSPEMLYVFRLFSSATTFFDYFFELKKTGIKPSSPKKLGTLGTKIGKIRDLLGTKNINFRIFYLGLI